MLKTIHQIGANCSQGVFVCNLFSLQIVYVNDAFATLFNTTKDDLILHPGKLLSVLCSEDITYLQQKHTEIIINGSFSDVEFCLSFPGEVRKCFRCDASVMDNHIIGFVKDISTEKEHEQYLVHHHTQSETLLDQLSAHRQERVLAEVKFPVEHTNDFLAKEHEACENLAIRKTRIDLIAELPMMLEELGQLNTNKRFRLICDRQHLNVTTDNVRLFMILHHLISNAIQHAPESELIDIIVESSPSVIRISVQDQGPGIPSDVIGSLFSNNMGDRNRGLQSVQVLATSLNGNVTCISGENQGTSMIVEFPRN